MIHDIAFTGGGPGRATRTAAAAGTTRRGFADFARSIGTRLAGRPAEQAAASLSRAEIVVGLDGSPVSERVLAYTFEQARHRKCTVRAVHAWLDRREPVHIEQEHLAPWRARYPEIEVIEDIRREHPVGALVSASRGANLLVVGARQGASGSSARLGSVARGVLDNARCPVAVVRLPYEQQRRVWAEGSFRPPA
ncbi:universal stress protein [Acrocarpospora catenulata]|uniref:universal stress protein n=1 Tax=Acrocarpospora catenulata TaxID=2836182 RepID=UPI001BD9E824|nr:universal stress protein [Acrocarpospora catenulata]